MANAGAGDAETEARPAAAFGAGPVAGARRAARGHGAFFRPTRRGRGRGGGGAVSARGPRSAGTQNALAGGGAWPRIGTARVAAEPGSREDGTSNVVAWRCVAPARARRPGRRRRPWRSRRTRSVPSAWVSRSTVCGASRRSLRRRAPWRRSRRRRRRYRRTFSGDAFSAPVTPTGLGAFRGAPRDVHPGRAGRRAPGPRRTPPAFAFGRASPRERARGRRGPSRRRARGDARRVPRERAPRLAAAWRGFRAPGSRAARATRIGIGIGFGDVLDTRSRSSSSSWLAETASVLVSSALVACEAPALASPGFHGVDARRRPRRGGAAAYRFLPDVSPGYASNRTVEAAPSTGPSRGARRSPCRVCRA